jgi:acetoin utilization deacetylase AcuC-like enzyme
MNRRQFMQYSTSAFLALSSMRYPFAAGQEQRMRTGYVSDKIYQQSHLAPDHPESPQRLIAVEKAMQKSGLLEQLEQLPLLTDVEQYLYTIHTQEHVASIKKHYPEFHPVALAVVGGVLSGVDAVCQGKVRNVFCATRPPGHHAKNTGREEGFCFYNAIAIAARYAQQKYNLEKILIVDWDYHHGNATEAAFYSDPTVLFFSTHDYLAYPGTGDPARKGEGAGFGYNINVHLGCGTTDADIIRTFGNVLVPAAEKFKPDIILISAGFDSRKDDLLGCYDVTDAGFEELTRITMSLADEFCDGRIVSILEGGYNVEGNANAVVHHVRTLVYA